MKYVLSALLIAGSLFSAPAFAYRIEFELTHEGRRVADAEVCFQKSLNAHHALDRWFTNASVRCFPADSVLDFPVGQWNFYGRHPSGLISSNPQMLNLTRAEPEAGYRRIRVELVEAATLALDSLELAHGENLFLYYPNEETETGAAVHVVPDEAMTVVIPAGVTVLPIVAKGGRPIRILRPLQVRAGEVGTPRDRARVPGEVDVISWIRMDVEELRALEHPERLRPVDVSLSVGDERFAPLFDLGGASAHLSLAIFTGLPRGSGRIELNGTHWRRYFSEPIQLTSGLVVVEEPLSTSPAGELTVRWVTPVRDRSTCSGAPKIADPHMSMLPVISVERCDPVAGKCTPVSVRRSDTMSGEIVFGSLEPGQYRVHARHAGLAPVSMDVTCTSGVTAYADLEWSGVSVRGRITRAEGPLAVFVQFERGATVSDAATGEYGVLLDRELKEDSVIRVYPCDGSHSTAVIVQQPLGDGSLFDIDLDGIDMVVRVSDASNGKGIAGASVTYAVLNDRDTVMFASKSGLTDSAGKALVAHLLNSTRFQVCATADGFVRTCTDTLQIARALRQNEIALPLRRSSRVVGRVISRLSFVGGTIYFVGYDGSIASSSRIREQNQFDYPTDAAGISYTIIVSSSQPLSLHGPPQRLNSGELRVEVRDDPGRRTFQVRLGPNRASSSGRLSLRLNGKVVPMAALNEHMIRRGLPIVVLPNRPTVVADIADVEIIEVLLAPSFEDLPPELARADVAALPGWAESLPRNVLGTRSLVVFE